MHEISSFLHYSEVFSHAALLIMATVYCIRIYWFTRFPAGKERQAATGLGDTTPRKGIIYSWLNVALPWAMESTRTKFFLYIQFVIFHLGVVAAIGLTFVIPYFPGLLNSSVFVLILQILIGGACLVGILRIIRRITDKYVRAISTPDDFFSVILLTVWFFFGFLAVPNDVSGGEWHLLAFFNLTTFFLLYVPFSKISHYLYYPFTRYYFGKTMGHRGVYPIKRFQ